LGGRLDTIRGTEFWADRIVFEVRGFDNEREFFEFEMDDVRVGAVFFSKFGSCGCACTKRLGNGGNEGCFVTKLSSDLIDPDPASINDSDDPSIQLLPEYDL
jgi:hypothetical protein